MPLAPTPRSAERLRERRIFRDVPEVLSSRRRPLVHRAPGPARPPPSSRAGRPSAPAGDTLIAAPTGSGKTLAAFLIALDLLLRESLAGDLPEETRVVYVSPLKALSADIHRNLAEPRREIRRLAEEMGLGTPQITAAVRSGDTPAAERAAMLRTPPHILVTTPESLYLLLTARAEPGDAAHGAHGHRGRDPRGARVAARRAPGAAVWSDWSTSRAGRSSGSGCRRRWSRSRRWQIGWWGRRYGATASRGGSDRPIDHRTRGTAASSTSASSFRSPRSRP